MARFGRETALSRDFPSVRKQPSKYASVDRCDLLRRRVIYNGARTGLATMAAEAPNPDLVLRWPPWLAARRARERRQHPRTTHDGAILNTPSELLWTKPYADSAVAVLW